MIPALPHDYVEIDLHAVRPDIGLPHRTRWVVDMTRDFLAPGDFPGALRLLDEPEGPHWLVRGQMRRQRGGRTGYRYATHDYRFQVDLYHE